MDVRETRSRRSRNTLLDPGHFSALSATPAATFPPCLIAGMHTHTCRVNIPVYTSVSTHAGEGHANTSLASAEQ